MKCQVSKLLAAFTACWLISTVGCRLVVVDQSGPLRETVSSQETGASQETAVENANCDEDCQIAAKTALEAPVCTRPRILHRRHIPAPQLPLESPPRSRFHPVPTRPVFEPQHEFFADIPGLRTEPLVPIEDDPGAPQIEMFLPDGPPEEVPSPRGINPKDRTTSRPSWIFTASVGDSQTAIR